MPKVCCTQNWESIPAIELFANSNEACNNFAKQSLHPNSKVTYYPTLSQRFHELQLQSFAQKFLTTTTKKKSSAIWNGCVKEEKEVITCKLVVKGDKSTTSC